MDQLKKRGWSLLNRCFLCCTVEESIYYILIHCTKIRVLWVVIYSLWCDISWHGSFVGKKWRRFRGRFPCVSFGRFEGKEIKLFLKMRSFRLKWWKKILFVIFSLGLKLFIDEGSCPLIYFFDWLCFKRGSMWFFVYHIFFLLLFLGAYCILPICFKLAFGWPFYLYIEFLCFY